MYADARIRTLDLLMSNKQADSQLKKVREKLSDFSCEFLNHRFFAWKWKLENVEWSKIVRTYYSDKKITSFESLQIWAGKNLIMWFL